METSPAGGLKDSKHRKAWRGESWNKQYRRNRLPDQLGNPIPDWLKSEFNSAFLMRDDIKRIHDCIFQSWLQRLPHFRSWDCPNLRAAMTELKAVLAKIKSSLPFCVCAMCDKFADKQHCYCHGTGWLSKAEYERVLADHPEDGKRLFRELGK